MTKCAVRAKWVRSSRTLLSLFPYLLPFYIQISENTARQHCKGFAQSQTGVNYRLSSFVWVHPRYDGTVSDEMPYPPSFIGLYRVC
mmetsp:Transcript_12407/g.31269  ORF Transcript_12407/g.31269 Transcript_12407/m.31269 type:complete len:86 (-) Transcript_12407:240-497(-)